MVAVDRFDAGYIDDGGRLLLDHNLRVAGLADRVRIEKADLTALPFNDNLFDSAVSTNVFDHLVQHKEQGLIEVFRVLKPGWPMFAVGNLLSFFLTSREGWQSMARRAGFNVIDKGVFNFAWFVLLEKPASPAPMGQHL